MTTKLAKTANPQTKAALEAFMEDNDLSLKKIASMASTSESMVSQYFGPSPVGNISKFEERVQDMLSNESRKRSINNEFFKSYTSEQCFINFELIRASNDVGIIYGAPGIGKTKASIKYAEIHPTCIRIEVPEWKANRYGIANLLYHQFENKKRKAKEGICEFLVRKLHSSNRLVIIDNAQRVPLSALRWVFDFNDATGTPFSLLGNPDKIMERLLSDNALSSRIGLCVNISTDHKDKKQGKDVRRWMYADADKMVKAMWPEASDNIRKLSHESVLEPGHLRRLKKQINIARTLTESPAWDRSNDAAFAYARSLLINGKEEL